MSVSPFITPAQVDQKIQEARIIDEAPVNGLLHARQDKMWVEIPTDFGVQTVTGDGVDNTDPENPVLSFPTPAEIGAYTTAEVDALIKNDIDIDPDTDIYDNVTALIADQNNQEEGEEYFVTDATDFPNITSGGTLVLYLGTTVGDETDYIILGNPGNISTLQTVTENGNTTTEKVGIGTAIIDTNVEIAKFGDGVPTDQKNLVAITKTHSENPTGSTNGLNIEITGIATATGAGRIARALKGVGLADPNGFELTNTGGGGLGVEGVVRAIGGNGGTITTATGGYFRILNNSTNVEITNAIAVYANNANITDTGTILRAIGVLVNNQNQLIGIGNTVEILIGQEGLADFTGNWAILSKSLYPSQFEKTIKVKEAPTEDEDVVRLVDVIGGPGELPFTNPTADGIENRKIQGADVGVSGSGQQVPRWNTLTNKWTSVAISTSAGPASIALRGPDGRTKVGDAVDPDEAVTKAQLDEIKQYIPPGNFTLAPAQNDHTIANAGYDCTINPNTETYADKTAVAMHNITDSTDGSIVCTAATGWTYKVNNNATVESGTFTFPAGATCTIIKYSGTNKIYINGGVE